MAIDDPFLAESYLGDPDYDRLSHSQFPSGLNQPPFSSAHSDDLGSMFSESEIVEFSGSSLSALSSEAETLLCCYLGDLYHGKIESSRADSLSGGRSSVHSDLFVNDASLANVPGIKLPPVFASEFAQKKKKLVPPRAGDGFHFVDEDHSLFFSSQTLAHETEAFGHSFKNLAPLANPLLFK